MLTTTLPVEPGDGTPQFVLDLASQLSGSMDVTIIAPRVRDAPRTQQVGAVAIRRFAYFPRRWEQLADGAILLNLRTRRILALQVGPLVVAQLIAALRAAHEVRPDVVNGHWIVPGGVLARVIAGVLRRPYVVTVHGADAHALHGRVARALQRFALRRAAAVLPTSDHTDEALPPTPQARRRVVPMGVDIPAVARAVGTRRPIHGRFLFVGRLAEKKGVDVLLRALAEVPEATLVVGGDGPDRATLERLAGDLGLTRRVSFLGHLDRAGVMSQYREAFALVVPSRIAADGDRDTTPVVMSEGMAAGVPVIASRLGGLGREIEHGITGTLVTSDSIAELAAALQDALERPDALEQRATAARSRLIGGALDLACTGRAYATVIRETLADRRPR